MLIRIEHGGPPIILTIGSGAAMPLLLSAFGRVFLTHLPLQTPEEFTAQRVQALDIGEINVTEFYTHPYAGDHGRTVGGLISCLSSTAFTVLGIDGIIHGAISFISRTLFSFCLSTATRNVF